MAVGNWMGRRFFNYVHRNNLVYNTCWEDPRLDRVALDLGPQDNLLVITSAGCNALDYALTGLNHVYAVDMNPRQNALLDLKIAGIKSLEFETFFSMFGRGRLPGIKRVYRDQLRPELSSIGRAYWDKRIMYFGRRRRSFYFRGTSGTFARMVNMYIDRIAKLRPWIDALLESMTLDEQQAIYDNYIRERLFTKGMRFAISRDATLSLVGVPKAQRVHLEETYHGGIAEFIEDCIEAVFSRLPVADNYFWRVYITGKYTRNCCPEYLKRENFQALKDGLVERVSTHTDSVQGFLEDNDVAISRYVLLDHMDWLCGKFYPLLEAEWQAIVDRAMPEARLIWRSGGMKTDFVDRINVKINGKTREAGELLTYNQSLAEELHEQDRVHTYGSFHIADLDVAA